MTHRERTIDRARYLLDMADEIGQGKRLGLQALAAAGVDAALMEKTQLDRQSVRAEPPDGWCSWCSSANAARWITLVIDGTESRLGVCADCYAELNRGR